MSTTEVGDAGERALEPWTKPPLMRRAMGLGVAFLPFGLACISVCAYLWSDAPSPAPGPGYCMMSLGSAIAVMNAWLSFGRPSLYSWRNGTLVGYRNISVTPALGTVALLLGIVFAFGNVWMALVAVIATALDTGGLPWFVLMTWRDQDLWDGTIRTR